VAVAVDAGEVRSAGGATASGRRSRNGLWEVNEKSLRDLFCYIIATLFFIYAAPQRRPLPSTAGEPALCLEEEDPKRTDSLKF
jgi:hypothetical protein